MANGKNKKSRKKLFIFGGIGLLLLVVVLLVVFSGNKKEIINVTTEKVAKRTITQTVTATGKINPEFKVAITPEVTGEIVSLPVKEGDHVKKGDVLIKIKADAYQASKQRNEAMLSSAKSNLAMNHAQLEKVKSDYNRMKGLFEKKLASEADLEAAKSNYLSTKANYEAAQAGVDQNAAALKETVEQLNKTIIYSPMEGTVSKLNVEFGERVLGSGYSQGTDIMTVSDLNNMEAIVDVDENDVVLVAVGDTARIKVDAFGKKEFIGIVSEIGNSAKTTGTGTQEQVVNFEVKIKVIDPDRNLRPGMSCNATIETQTKQDVISVPIQSITARQGEMTPAVPEKDEAQASVKTAKKKENEVKELVFVVENGIAKTRYVKTGISDDNYIEVIEGLKGNEMVVSGNYRAISRELNDGSVVKVEDKKKFTDKK
jgi:HlyD family secretion protein